MNTLNNHRAAPPRFLVPNCVVAISFGIFSLAVLSSAAAQENPETHEKHENPVIDTLVGDEIPADMMSRLLAPYLRWVKRCEMHRIDADLEVLVRREQTRAALLYLQQRMIADGYVSPEQASQRLHFTSLERDVLPLSDPPPLGNDGKGEAAAGLEEVKQKAEPFSGVPKAERPLHRAYNPKQPEKMAINGWSFILNGEQCHYREYPGDLGWLSRPLKSSAMKANFCDLRGLPFWFAGEWAVTTARGVSLPIKAEMPSDMIVFYADGSVRVAIVQRSASMLISTYFDAQSDMLPTVATVLRGKTAQSVGFCERWILATPALLLPKSLHSRHRRIFV